jgi:rhamnogalacturonyl hydrolase YesR
VAYSGPLFKTMKVSGNKAVLSFEYAEDGLVTPENAPVKGFLVAGADRRFYPAVAVIKGSRLEVSAPQVAEPVAVRYGFCNFFRVNLYNKSGLPAVPFRTDTWEQGSYARWFADSEMMRFPQAYRLDHGKRLFFGYAQGVGCCAMLQMWKATGERRYYDYVKQWADSLINEKGEIHLYDKSTYNLDFINSGKVLFDLYRETGDQRYKAAMDILIKQLKNQPRTLEGGFWHKLIYQHQMWLDGLYMASPFMAQYGAEFNKPEWIDEAVKQFRLCHKHTYDAKTGLYHHAWDESKSQRWANPETGHSPNFWGRSIGWWFMALVDALDYIPENHPGRADMIGYIRGLAETLPKYQDKAGLWYQVIDQPKRKGNFPEASVTTQCMYAYAKAVNKGYIDAGYRAVAEKALQGLKDKLLVEKQDGTLTLTRCCQVGGLGGHPYRDGSFEYYIGEKMRDNDAKATGPFIMGCLELEKIK